MNGSTHHICVCLSTIISESYNILINLLISRFLSALIIVFVILPTNPRHTTDCDTSIWASSYHLASRYALWIHLELWLGPSVGSTASATGCCNTPLLLLLNEASKVLDLLNIHLPFGLCRLSCLLRSCLVNMKRNGLLLLLQFPLLLLFLYLFQGIAGGIWNFILLRRHFDSGLVGYRSLLLSSLRSCFLVHALTIGFGCFYHVMYLILSTIICLSLLAHSHTPVHPLWRSPIFIRHLWAQILFWWSLRRQSKLNIKSLPELFELGHSFT